MVEQQLVTGVERRVSDEAVNTGRPAQSGERSHRPPEGAEQTLDCMRALRGRPPGPGVRNPLTPKQASKQGE